MSNDFAIAAVTATLHHLLDTSLNNDPDGLTAGTTVTAKPPDKARSGETTNQVNLFLYQSLVNSAWRNHDMPGVKPGETGFPPLALNLHYLITAYGANEDEVAAQRLMGRALRTLHDHSVLGAAEIKAALAAADLDRQVERVRLTWQALTMDEATKLWTCLQTQYRHSAALEASVVLIESRRPTRAPLPVLTRAKDDRGPSAQTDTLPPLPTLTGLTLPNGQTVAQLGETVTLTGHHLDGDGAATAVFAQFLSFDVAPPIEMGPLGGGTATRIEAPLVAAAAADTPRWRAGTGAIRLRIQRTGEPDQFSSPIPLSIAPRIVQIAPRPAPRANGKVTLTLDVAPPVGLAQATRLFVGDQEFTLQARQTDAAPLVFVGNDVAAGTYLARLRVAEVDSVHVRRDVVPPQFDATQQIEVL